MKRGVKYSVYLSGWVCQGDKYLFRIDDEQILNYILGRRWTFRCAKERLDYLLDNYPDVFLEIFRDNLIDEMIDKMV